MKISPEQKIIIYKKVLSILKKIENKKQVADDDNHVYMCIHIVKQISKTLHISQCESSSIFKDCFQEFWDKKPKNTKLVWFPSKYENNHEEFILSPRIKILKKCIKDLKETSPPPQ